jgi:hypothetical protein
MTPLYYKETPERIYCFYCSPQMVDFDFFNIYESCGLIKSCQREKPFLSHTWIWGQSVPPTKLSEMDGGYLYTDKNRHSSKFMITGYQCEFCNQYIKDYILLNHEGYILTEDYRVSLDDVLVICENCGGGRFSSLRRNEHTYTDKPPILTESMKTVDSLRLIEIYNFKKNLQAQKTPHDND